MNQTQPDNSKHGAVFTVTRTTYHRRGLNSYLIWSCLRKL